MAQLLIAHGIVIETITKGVSHHLLGQGVTKSTRAEPTNLNSGITVDHIVAHIQAPAVRTGGGEEATVEIAIRSITEIQAGIEDSQGREEIEEREDHRDPDPIKESKT